MSSPRAAEVESTKIAGNPACNEDIRKEIARYDWDTELMVAIALAESYCRADADNTGTNRDGSYDIGVFQINSIHGQSKEAMMDYKQNIAYAYKIYNSQGLRAWSVYNNGAYLKYYRQ